MEMMTETTSETKTEMEAKTDIEAGHREWITESRAKNTHRMCVI